MSNECAVTIRCPCGTYVRATQIYPAQAYQIVDSWLTNHGRCTRQGEPRE
jgi:hypothetical protein